MMITCECGQPLVSGCDVPGRFSVDLTKVVNRHIPRIVSGFDSYPSPYVEVFHFCDLISFHEEKQKAGYFSMPGIV